MYLGIHLDRTLSYKLHIQKTKMKGNARNNIIRKLANSKWAGCRATTLRTSCLALCYSATEHAYPVWARSGHANKLNPAIHECCRIITGCLKPVNVTSILLLIGIAPPHIRRTVASHVERQRQTTQTSHQLYGNVRTICWPTEIAEQRHAHVDTARRGSSGVRWTACHAKTTTRRWGYIDNTHQSTATVENCKQWLTASATGYLALLPGRPHHHHREGKCMCPDVATPCAREGHERR